MSELPAEHQLRCPFALVQLQRPHLLNRGESPAILPEQLTCPDRRCCIWLDLRSWFGLDAAELPVDEFRLAFTDIAHGGSGLYEKLIVLGHRALETFSEMYIYEQFDPTGIPADLLGGREIPEEVTRVTWTRKRVERLIAPQSLHSFSKAYLSTAQSLPTETSCVKFVKACVGYAVQLPNLEARRLFEWMPTLVEHIYWAQRIRVEEYDEDNEILQDMQEYFGYPYNKLIPRTREALETDPTISARTDTPTGRDLIRFFAFDYFRCLAEESKISLDRRAAWITDETEHFMASYAIRMFAACWLNLGPYMATISHSVSLPDSKSYASMFEALLATCYVLSSEEKSRIWMCALMHRLRQVQLTIRLRELDLLSGGPTGSLEDLQNIDIHRWSSLSNVLQHRLLNWTLASLDDISVLSLQAPSGIPSQLLREAEREGKLPAPSVPQGTPEHSTPPTLMDELKSVCFPCLRPHPAKYPIQLLESPSGPPLELLPIGPLYDKGKTLPASPIYQKPLVEFQPEHQLQSKSQSTRPDDSFWQTLGGKESSLGILNSVPSSPRNNTSPQDDSHRVIFRCHPRRGRLTEKFSNCWKTKHYDSDGDELWRPPGAILMRRRKLKSHSVQPEEHDLEQVAEFPKSSPPAVSPKTSTESSTDSEVQLDIHYSIPQGAKPSNRPVEAVLYASDSDLQSGRPPLLRAILDMTPDQRDEWEANQTLKGTQFKATLYTDPADPKNKPVHIDFVPQGPTGSPRVYVSGPREVETKSGKSTIKKKSTYASAVASNSTNTTSSTSNATSTTVESSQNESTITATTSTSNDSSSVETVSTFETPEISTTGTSSTIRGSSTSSTSETTQSSVSAATPPPVCRVTRIPSQDLLGMSPLTVAPNQLRIVPYKTAVLPTPPPSTPRQRVSRVTSSSGSHIVRTFHLQSIPSIRPTARRPLTGVCYRRDQPPLTLERPALPASFVRQRRPPPLYHATTRGLQGGCMQSGQSAGPPKTFPVRLRQDSGSKTYMGISPQYRVSMESMDQMIPQALCLKSEMNTPFKLTRQRRSVSPVQE